jgi:hypothetical protein
MPKKSEGFAFLVTDGRFMAIVEHHTKTRLPSNAELGTNAAHLRFTQKADNCCGKLLSLQVAQSRNKTTAGQTEATQGRCALNKITAGKTEEERRQAMNALNRCA